MKTFHIIFFLLATGLLHSQTPRLVVPIGHSEMVSSMAFSPDGKTILTGSYDHTAKLWDLDGRMLQTFNGHAAEVLSVAFSPDGKTILTGSADKTAKLWDLDGRMLQTFKGHVFGVLSVAFSPDGKTILTSSDDNTAELWDLDGSMSQTFIGHWDHFDFESVAFSLDGKTILTGSADSTAKLWNLEGEVLQTFEGHAKEVTSVAFSPDGKTILTGSADNTARLWDLDDGRMLKTFKGHVNKVTSVAFSPDGKTILTGSADKSAKLWDLDGRMLKTLNGHTDGVWSVAFSPDGKTILTDSADKSAKLWDLDGRMLKTLTFKGSSNGVHLVTFSPDGKTILTSNGYDQTTKLWDLDERMLKTFNSHADGVSAVAFSPDGKTILTGNGYDQTARLWDLNGRMLQTFKGHAKGVSSVAFSPDGKSILTGSDDNTARLWDLDDGRMLKTLTGHSGGVSAVAFSPDGKTILTGSRDFRAHQWDLKGRIVRTFNGHFDFNFDPMLFGSMVFSPDSKTILTVWARQIYQLWDWSGREVQTFKNKIYSGRLSLVFSPNGETILTNSDGNTAKLWNLEGRALQTFKGHASRVSSVAFSSDGNTVLTSSDDNTTKLWNAQTGHERATLIAIDTADWVVTTPSGLFDATPGAMQQLYYVLGLEVIEIEQLKERYYEPGLLAKIMGFSTEPLRSVSGFDSIAIYPKVALRLDTAQNRLHVQLRPRNGGTGKVSVFINGKEIIEDANPPRGFEKTRDTSLTIELDKFARYFLFDSLNTVSVRAYNEAGWLKSAAQSVMYRPNFANSRGTDKTTGTSLNRLRSKPALHAIVVGTADYAGTKLDLKYSGKDACDMAAALQQIGGQLFGADSVFVQLLTTDTSRQTLPPTKANIKAAFDALKSRAKAEDILVVYFSGHGVSYGEADRALFYYLTMDIANENLNDAGLRAGRTVSSAELTRWINDIPAQKQVLILDACNSGRVVENLAAGQKELNSSQIRALDRMKDRTGMFVLTGSAADKVSYEARQYGQGLLTYSLLQGMSGLALTADKRVDVSTLFEYARDVVPQLAKGIGGVQTPMMVGPLRGSFDIGVVNEKVKIPLAQVKPVFIRNSFQEEKQYDDVLGLTKALAEHFQQITARGAQANLIYVDVNEYENAYSIKGRYTIDGNDVVVSGYLFEGKTPVGAEFKVLGKKDNIPALVEAIVEKVSEML
ncbi:MAG: caspase family protein [Saprospiraceae bacterium]|nr:caspase family protein [Saprospiraceae bacterium]